MSQDYRKTPEALSRLTPHAVPRHAGGRHRAAVPQRVLEQPRGRHLRRRRLGPAAVLVDRQVRQRHRMAELHPAPRARRRHREGRRHALDEAHRGALVGRRQPPRPRLRRRPGGCRWPALLHELRRAALRARSPSSRSRATATTARCSPTTTHDTRMHATATTRRRRIMTGPTPEPSRTTPAPRRPSSPAAASGAWRTSSAASPACSTRASATPAAERPRHLPQPPGPRRGGRDRLRPREDDLPRHPGVLLPDPRPVDAEPPGQRHRHRATARRSSRSTPEQEQVARDTIADVDASGLWPGKAVTDDRARRPVLGGRARAPGLPGADPERLHVPLRAPGLGAAQARRGDRGLGLGTTHTTAPADTSPPGPFACLVAHDAAHRPRTRDEVDRPVGPGRHELAQPFAEAFSRWRLERHGVRGGPPWPPRNGAQ